MDGDALKAGLLGALRPPEDLVPAMPIVLGQGFGIEKCLSVGNGFEEAAQCFEWLRGSPEQFLTPFWGLVRCSSGITFLAEFWPSEGGMLKVQPRKKL